MIIEYVSLYKTYLDNVDKFIFQKKKIESSFLADHGAAILRICKNAAVWLAEKVILIHFVRINKLDVFTGHLPAEN